MATEPGPDLPGPSPGPLRVECECGWTRTVAPSGWQLVETHARRVWAVHERTCDGESRTIRPVDGGDDDGE